MVATEGWLDVSKTPAIELAEILRGPRNRRASFTRTSPMTACCNGIDDGTIADLVRLAELGFPVIASGGVTTVDDIRRLAAAAKGQNAPGRSHRRPSALRRHADGCRRRRGCVPRLTARRASGVSPMVLCLVGSELQPGVERRPKKKKEEREAPPQPLAGNVLTLGARRVECTSALQLRGDAFTRPADDSLSAYARGPPVLGGVKRHQTQPLVE